MPEKMWYAALGLAASVGWDWAMDKHALTLKDFDSGQRERCQLGNTPEAIELWAAALAVRFQGRPVAVAVEQSRGAVINILSSTRLVLFRCIRDAGGLSQGDAALRRQDDPTDGDNRVLGLRGSLANVAARYGTDTQPAMADRGETEVCRRPDEIFPAAPRSVAVVLSTGLAVV